MLPLMIIALATFFAPGCSLKCYQCLATSPATDCDALNLKLTQPTSCDSANDICTSSFTATNIGTMISRTCGLRSTHQGKAMNNCTISGDAAICICSKDSCNTHKRINVALPTPTPVTSTTSGGSTLLTNSFINIIYSVLFILTVSLVLYK